MPPITDFRKGATASLSLPFTNQPKSTAILRGTMTGILENGLLAKAFPGKSPGSKTSTFLLDELLDCHSNGDVKCKFEKSGMVLGRMVVTSKYQPNHDGPFTTIADVMQNEED